MEKEEQIKKNIPELNFYENTLAMKITVLKGKSLLYFKKIVFF